MVGDRAVKAESRERERGGGTEEKRTLDSDKYFFFFFFFSTTRCRFSLWAERGEEKKVWDFFFFF